MTFVWKKLLRNRLAVFGLVIIFIAFLVAIFCYFIAPDHTPSADLQTLEIQAKRPGYTQTFLMLPKTQAEKVTLLQQFISGKPAAFDQIPISGYKVINGKYEVLKYVDDDTSVVQYVDIPAGYRNNPQKLIQTKTYHLGTDAFGRDILSRLMVGTRVSLAVGLIAVIISLTLGILLGALAGYYGGRTDNVIMWLVNVTWSIPTLLLVFAITMAMGKGFLQIFIAVGLTLWVSVARLVRGQIMAVKELEYIQAARALGFGDLRIIFRHILPNILGPILVVAAGNFATAIIVEAGLSFLGIGVQPPQPSWGLMIKENYNFIITNIPMLALVPGFAIMLLVLAFNLVGNALRDAVDVR